MIIEFVIHWKEIHWNFFEQRYHWLYLPLIISLFPLMHTIEIVNRLIRILIPMLTKKFILRWSFYENFIICAIIAIPTIFFIFIFLPILQRIKYLGLILISLTITFLIIFIFAYNRQPFTNIHPNTFYVNHTSESIFEVKELSHIPLTSQSSSIAVFTFNDLALSPVLDQFSAKSGYLLRNRQCSGKILCTFDDTFNRKVAVENIKIESMKNFLHYTIIVQHVLSYNIQVLSPQFIKFIVRDPLNIPRTETRIDLILNSTLLPFNIEIKISRCDLIDAPFLLLFTRLMPHIVPVGDGRCRAIVDHTTVIIDPNNLSH
jgi:hypothetical protein